MGASQPLKLYGRQGSGSAVVEAVLRLTGEPFEIVDFERWPEGDVPAALLAVNPLGHVPVLVLPDGTALCESAAIVLHLCDLRPEAGLAPSIESPDRGPYLRWMMHLAAGIYMTELRMYYPHRYTADRAGVPDVRAAAAKRLNVEWSIVSHALSDRAVLVGDHVTAVDIYAAMLMSWAHDLDRFFDTYPRLAALYRRVDAIPAVAEVWRRHEMPTA